MSRVRLATLVAIFIILLFSVTGVWIALVTPHRAPAARVPAFMLISAGLAVVSIAAIWLTYNAHRREQMRMSEILEALKARKAVPDGEFGDLARACNALLQDYRKGLETSGSLSDRVDREERLTALGRLAAGLAHEIRNPITNVSGFAMLALERCKDPSIRKDLETIIEEARRCESITDSILAFSRVPRVVKEACDLGDLVPLVPEIETRSRIDPQARMIMADRTLLGRVLDNLVRNAAQAGAAAVDVVIERAGAQARIVIADDGRGIPKEMLEQLFEPFATSRQGGLGLGLALARGIIHAHGGTITAANRPEGGARFEILLPVK